MIGLLDLKSQFAAIEGEVRAAIDRVLESQYFIMGPELVNFERHCARYLNCDHAIGVSSGSDALLVSLMALDIGPGDEVITTPYTFFATAGAIARLGAKAVFVDIEEESYNINAQHIAQAIGPATKAIVPVHLYGQAADMGPLRDIAKQKGLSLVEDAAQALGTEYQGKRVGGGNDLSCFSFFPSKNLGGIGDGGLVSTDNPELAEKISILRLHGSKPKYHHKYIGGNFRMDAINAAVLDVKLKYLDQWTQKRQENAQHYGQLLADLARKGHMRLPKLRAGDRHIYNQYVVRFETHAIRERVQAHLKEHQIATEVYYPLPMHLQECFSDWNYQPGDFPISESCAQTTLALPVHPDLSEAQLSEVAQKISEVF